MQLASKLCLFIGNIGIVLSVGFSLPLLFVAAFIGLFGGYSIPEFAKGNPEWTQYMTACVGGLCVSLALRFAGMHLRKRAGVSGQEAARLDA